MSELLDTIMKMRESEGQPALHPLVAAAMVGGAHLAGDAAEKRTAEAEAEAQSKVQVTLHPGKGTATLKDMPLTDFASLGAENGTAPIAAVHRVLQQFGIQTKDPQEDLHTDTFRGAYGGARELDADPLTAAIQALKVRFGFGHVNPEEAARQVHNARAESDLKTYKDLVGPVLTNIRQLQGEGRRQSAEDRMQQTADHQEHVQDARLFESLTDPASLSKAPDVETAIANVKRGMGGQLAPGDEAAIRNAYPQAVNKVNSAKFTARKKSLREQITPETVSLESDPEAYIESINDPSNPFTEPDKVDARNRFKKAREEWRTSSNQKKMALTYEGQRIQLENLKIQQQKQLVEASQYLNDPATKAAFADHIAANGALYYSPQVQKNPYTKAAVDAELTARYGRTPNKLDKTSEERLLSTRMGMKDLADIDSSVADLKSKGYAVNGPMLGRFDENTAQFGSSNLFALQGVKAQDRAFVAEKLMRIRNAITNVTLREARAASGGRTAVQIAQWLKAVSPNLAQDPSLFVGATKSLRKEFINSQNSVYEQQWGGTAPVKVLSEEEAQRAGHPEWVGSTLIWDPNHPNPKAASGKGAWIREGTR